MKFAGLLKGMANGEVIFIVSHTNFYSSFIIYRSWKNWESIPIEQLNTILAVHALNLLALCYLPGCIAGWIQIGRGTKYSRFPNWLDQWLKMRKQLGLFMLLSASIHVSTYEKMSKVCETLQGKKHVYII